MLWKRLRVKAGNNYFFFDIESVPTILSYLLDRGYDIYSLVNLASHILTRFMVSMLPVEK